jgi:hypothetical protein
VKDQLNVFVLMPFEPAFDEVWQIIEKPLRDAGYRVERADTDPTHGNVLRDVVRGIAEADLVVADLTNANANVFYELGLSHGLKVPTILITQSAQEVPFDLLTYRFVPYTTGYAAAQELQEKLREIAAKRATGELEFGSPVIDFLPEGSPTPDSRSVGHFVEGQPDEERMKALQIFTVVLSEQIAQTLDAFALLLRRWSDPAERFEDQRARLQIAQREGGESGLAVARGIASEIQQTLEEVADILSEYVPDLQTRVEKLTESTAGLSIAVETGYGTESRKRLLPLKQGLDSTHAGATNALGGVTTFRQEVGEIRGITPELDNAIARAVQELDRAVFPFMALQAFGLRTVAMLDARLGPIDSGEFDEVPANEVEGEPATADDESQPPPDPLARRGGTNEKPA